MKWIWQTLLLVCLVCGCKSRAPDDTPAKVRQADDTPAKARQADDVSDLKRQFTDLSVSRSGRLAAARALLGTQGGPAFLAGQDQPENSGLVQALLDSLAGADPVLASRLAVSLMATARGEEKLHFASLLLKQGPAAVAPLIRLVEGAEDWQTVLQALDVLGKLKARESIPVLRTRLQDANSWILPDLAMKNPGISGFS